MKKFLFSALLSALSFVGFGVIFGAPLSAHAATVNTVIQGPTGTTLYWYASNGKRYVFPNANTYFTWFTNFANVQRVTTNDLAAIPLAGNVTYRPGARLVKIESDEKVYAVSRYGVLRWVTSPTVASQLYGNNWAALVQDIPVTFFSNYTVGSPIYGTADYNVSTAYGSVANPSDNIPNGSVPIVDTRSISLSVSPSAVATGQTVTIHSTLSSNSGNTVTVRYYDERDSRLVSTCTQMNADCYVYDTARSVSGSGASYRYYALATDVNGYTYPTAYSPYVTLTTGTSVNGFNTGTSVSGAVTNRSGNASSESIEYTATVANTNGTDVNNITVRIYDNGTGELLQTCTANTICRVTLTSSISVTRTLYARATDQYGYNVESSRLTVSYGSAYTNPTTLTGTTSMYATPNPARIGETINITASISGANVPTSELTTQIYNTQGGSAAQTCSGASSCTLQTAAASAFNTSFYAIFTDRANHTLRSTSLPVSAY